MNGTPSEIPGWYINFMAAVIKQLPRPDELDEATADSWEKNQGNLKTALALALLPSPNEEIQVVSGKFFLTKTLKVTIPKDYNHATRLMYLPHFLVQQHRI
ncbi:MAG TPA: hypothetical protein VJJ28_01990 [Candidatus Paceibacterota bacterium]